LSLIHEALKKVEDTGRPGHGLGLKLSGGTHSDARERAVKNRFTPVILAFLSVAVLIGAVMVFYPQVKSVSTQAAIVNNPAPGATKPVASAPERVNPGVVHYRAGRYDTALSEFEAAIKSGADNALNHNNAGLAAMAMGQAAVAEAHYKEALALQAEFPEALNNYGALLFARRASSDSERAVDFFKHAIELRPGYADAELNLAIALDRLGRTNDAATHYERFIQLDPAGEGVEQAARRLALIRQLRAVGVDENAGRP